uniref:Uncharacterized protein n=1 Tax=Aegilops tauschii subsp. strangulata TaxID=200361 RepID=A0A453NNZ5_AEGTS
MGFPSTSCPDARTTFTGSTRWNPPPTATDGRQWWLPPPHHSALSSHSTISSLSPQDYTATPRQRIPTSHGHHRPPPPRPPRLQAAAGPAAGAGGDRLQGHGVRGAGAALAGP